ncbi:MAG: AI-2E family transporter [Firmicutes bacterium]|nr:AI-2E family transporter [Bacillota bacterium]
MLIQSQNEWKFAFRFWIAALIVAVSAWIIYQILPLLTMIMIAFLLVYVILPLVNFLASTRIPYAVSAIGAFSLIMISIGLFIYFLIPGIAEDISHFIKFTSEDLVPFINDIIARIEVFESSYNLQISRNLATYFSLFVEQIPTHLQNILSNLSSFSMSFFAGVWAVIMVVFMILYMLLFAKDAGHEFYLLFPKKYRHNVRHLFSVVNEKVGAYIRGTMAKSILVGVLTGVALSVVGLPFPLVLGVLAGMLNIILVIGPVLAAIPAILISFAPGTPHFLLIIAIYLVVQALDSFLFTPVFLGKAVDLSPLTVIILVVGGSYLAGVIGIIISVPVAAIVKVLFYHYYVHGVNNNNNGSPDPDPAGEET